MTNNPTRDLSTVIGTNAKRLRKEAELTLDQVAIAARQRGLKWNASRVADFEAGRVSPNLATLTAFALALADAGCADLTFADLVDSDTPVRINDSILLGSVVLFDAMNGAAVEPNWGKVLIGPGRIKIGDRVLYDGLAERRREVEEAAAEQLGRYLKHTDAETVRSILMTSGSAEHRVQRALRLSPELLAAASAALWGRSFSAERDARAGKDANAQKRGQITRRLQSELEGELNGGDD
ncbi:hypothetical protein GTA28_11625 [Rhodococcus hoagii]|nr:hypothetical protein [Prescottella equi]